MMVTSCYKEYPVGNLTESKSVGEKVFVERDIYCINHYKTVVSMQEHESRDVGDTHYVMVFYDDGTATKICNPDSIEYKEG